MHLTTPNKISFLKKRQIKLILEIFFFACLFLVLFAKEIQVVNLRQVDTVMFMEAIENTQSFGVPLSAANKSMRDAASMFSWNTEKVCTTEPYATDGAVAKNTLQNHAYYSVYLLAPFSYIFDIKHLAASIHVLTYVLFAWLIFRCLLQRGVSTIPSLLFLILVLSQPNWSLGVQGQYYFDRLFMPMGFLLANFLSKSRNHNYDHRTLILIVIITLLTASIHERAALMVSIFFFAFSFIFYKEIDKKYFKMFILLAFVSGLYSVGITSTFVSDALPSNSSLYLKAVKDCLNPSLIFGDPLKMVHIYVFICVNCILAVFGLFSKRYLFIALIMMLPNILIWAPGAASKTGWLTHYHSYYFPFLVFAAAQGFGVLMSQKSYRLLGLIVTSSLIVISLFLVPYPGQFGLSLNAVKGNALVSAFNFLSTKETSQKVFLSYMDRLSQIIPQGSSVSTLEGFFPTLFEGRRLFYFPMGLEEVDYVVLSNRTEQKEKPRFYTSVTYNGAQEKYLIDICMEDRLERLGFDIKNRTTIGYFSVIPRK